MQPGPGKQGFHLVHPAVKIFVGRIHQQNQIIAVLKPGANVTVYLPAKTFGPVPFHRIPELSGQGKAYSVVKQIVFTHKKLRSGAANTPSPVKNFPNFIPFLQMFLPVEPKGDSFSVNRAFSRPKYSVLSGPWPFGA
jgi:hypothetical protein